MRVETEKIKTVLRKVQEIKEDEHLYCLAPDRIPVSLDDLQWVIEQRCEITITIKYVDFDAKYLRGVLERSKTEATIYVRENQTDGWHRFVIAKELSQLVIDEKEDWSIDAVETIEGLVFDAVLDDIEDFPLAVQSEILATISAAEFMFPRELRPTLRRQLDDDETTLKRIALDFELPESVVGWGLSKKYNDLIDSIVTENNA